ncbi:hypothetical protein PUN28_010596 [Cardiocondyla obscurior]|uniref:Uncharacterized protein n=1 Tax=Cardiocondyla obscurior TaxID=286306 RepID=A0AAW2FGQ3_9HYME
MITKSHLAETDSVYTVSNFIAISSVLAVIRSVFYFWHIVRDISLNRTRCHVCKFFLIIYKIIFHHSYHYSFFCRERSSRIAVHSCAHSVSPTAICIRVQYNFRGISELYKRQTRRRLYAVMLAQNSSSCKKEPQYDADGFIMSLGTYADSTLKKIAVIVLKNPRI